MDIVVTPDLEDCRRGHVRWRERIAPCALGRSGVVAESAKREGDGATPAGRFALRRVLWRADRGPVPATGLMAAAIGRDDGWCDDATRPEYNRMVRLPFAGSAERLWRDDALYDLVVVLGHNDAPPKPGAGSAIFLHVAAPGFRPTEGCVAMDEGDLRALLADAAPGDTMTVATAAHAR
jgi:L,D-peptidoglycan transpeptidase YkuD (ErfK/YbiS/YcfS/YnhG family)